MDTFKLRIGYAINDISRAGLMYVKCRGTSAPWFVFTSFRELSVIADGNVLDDMGSSESFSVRGKVKLKQTG